MFDIDVEMNSASDLKKDIIFSKSIIVAVGMWTDNSIRILKLPDLYQVNSTQLGMEIQTQARDIILVQLEGKVYLLVGLGDGNLISFNISLNFDADENGKIFLPNLTNRRKGVLGTHPISFNSFINSGELCIFAACDRPTIIYSRNGKLLFSVLNSDKSEIFGMTPFNSELFPDCLALTSESHLVIGTIDGIQKLHIQSISLQESPRRIAHCATGAIYAGIIFLKYYSVFQ
jgi:DNA damage-binding protein 1